MKIVTAAEMREIDRLTGDRFGVPSLTLMENAGTAVADFALSRFPAAKTIGIICGKGNNGGDGIVAARKLHAAGKSIQILLLAEPRELKGDAAEMFSKLPFAPVIATTSEQLRAAAAREALTADLLLDALLGTGFHPPVAGLYAEAIAIMNASSSTIIAVDIPSGADADLIGEQSGAVARADAMVTFTAPRPAHIFGGLTAGPTVIAPIGSPDEAIRSSQQLNLITPRDFALHLAPRARASHKGSFGNVLVIGGSLGKAGAAAMAGFSALKAGVGLSTVATPKSVLPTVAGFHPEVMTEALEETDTGSISLRALSYGRLDSLAENKSVLAIGPGIGRHPETSEFVRTIVTKYQLPVVLDADGLNAFEGHAAELSGAAPNAKTLVITPHPGEMSRLTGLATAAIQRDRINVARSFAKEHHLTVVLKGHRTLVAAPDGEVWVNTTGNPGMATGGTGDILTGIVAGLLAQSPDHVFESVIAAVHLHGLAGDAARESVGEHCLTATDLLRFLPEAFRRAQASLTITAVEIPA